MLCSPKVTAHLTTAQTPASKKTPPCDLSRNSYISHQFDYASPLTLRLHPCVTAHVLRFELTLFIGLDKGWSCISLMMFIITTGRSACTNGVLKGESQDAGGSGVCPAEAQRAFGPAFFCSCFWCCVGACHLLEHHIMTRSPPSWNLGGPLFQRVLVATNVCRMTDYS